MRADGRGYPDRVSTTGGAAFSLATGTLESDEHEAKERFAWMDVAGDLRVWSTEVTTAKR